MHLTTILFRYMSNLLLLESVSHVGRNLRTCSFNTEEMKTYLCSNLLVNGHNEFQSYKIKPCVPIMTRLSSLCGHWSSQSTFSACRHHDTWQISTFCLNNSTKQIAAASKMHGNNCMLSVLWFIDQTTFADTPAPCMTAGAKRLWYMCLGWRLSLCITVAICVGSLFCVKPKYRHAYHMGRLCWPGVRICKLNKNERLLLMIKMFYSSFDHMFNLHFQLWEVIVLNIPPAACRWLLILLLPWTFIILPLP